MKEASAHDEHSSVEKAEIAGTSVDLKSTEAFTREDITWTPEEERKLVRKMDFRIVSLVTLYYLCNFIDRTNVGNAKVAGLEKDVHLVGNQFNIGLSLFYIIYALTEVPSNLILKRFGARMWIPTIVLAFGVVCACTSVITNFSGFMAVRFFLGLTEGGMVPGVAYYLSMWYTRDELAFRIGFFVSAASLSGAFGGLLATAFLSIPQLKGLPHGQWRNIFLIEGVLTVVIGLTGFWLLPRAPEHSEGFLNERERTIAMERMRKANAGIAEAEKTDWKLVKRAYAGMNTWICAFGFFLANIIVQGISLFMPTLLAGMGYSKIESQLRSVPPYIVASVWSIFIGWCCQKSGKRGMWVLVTTPFCIIGSALLLSSATSRNVKYGGIFLFTMGAFPLGPIFLTWGSNNAAPYTTRAVASAWIVSFASFGPIISAWLYLPKSAPRFTTALWVQLGCQLGLMALAVFLMFWNTRENRIRAAGKRDGRLQADEYTVQTLGNKHPKFMLKI